MIFKDYYKVLELKTNRVSSDEIKNAYRLAVKKNHPDLNVADKLAEEKIKDILEVGKEYEYTLLISNLDIGAILLTRLFFMSSTKLS